MKSYDVKIWALRPNRRTDPATGKEIVVSHTVRWIVAGHEQSKTFRNKTPAEHYRSDLLQAAKAGEPFDTKSGLPASMLRAENTTTVHELACRYVDKQWKGAAATTRRSMLDALATIAAALVADRPGKPERRLLYRALNRYGLAPGERDQERPPEIDQALTWLKHASLPVVDLDDDEDLLDAVLTAIALKLDGTSAATNTTKRKRAVLHHFFEYASTGKKRLLDTNPLHANKRKPPKSTYQVDRRVVINARQARELLIALTYVGSRDPDRGRRLVAFFACLYYGGLRPEEATSLREGDLELPDDPDAWGWIYLTRTSPEAGTRYTDTGTRHDSRGLKHRPDDEVRPVPIPPELVALLKAHLAEFGTTPQGHLFRTTQGNPIGSASYCDAWQRARRLALTPDRVASPLVQRPYDLRHAAVSGWLNAGVAPTDVADRAGQSVEVLLRIYAKCLDGGLQTANAKISKMLRAA